MLTTTNHMERYEDSLYKLKRFVAGIEQKGRECLSLLKYSEGLVKKDIEIVRTQIDLRLKKLEKKVLNDLKELHSSEKENVHKVLTNSRSLLERANTCSSNEKVIKETKYELAEEMKKIATKQIVFEANKGLFPALEQMKTLGNIIVKELKERGNENTIDKNVNESSISLQESVHFTDGGRTKSPKNGITKNVLHICTSEHNGFCKNQDIDPFAILRSMKANNSGIENISLSYEVEGIKNGDIQNKCASSHSSKHVTFSDNITSNKDAIRGRTDYCELNEIAYPERRGRAITTKMGKMRRARSASPRTHRLQPSCKDDQPHGILKHKSTELSHVSTCDNENSCITATSHGVKFKHDTNSFHIQKHQERIPVKDRKRTQICDIPHNDLTQNGDIHSNIVERPCEGFIEKTGCKFSATEYPVTFFDERHVMLYQQHRSLDEDVKSAERKPKSDSRFSKSTADKRKRNLSVSADISQVLQEARKQFETLTDFNNCTANKKPLGQEIKKYESNSNKDKSFSNIGSKSDGSINNKTNVFVSEDIWYVQSNSEEPLIHAKDSDSAQISVSPPH